MSRPHVSRRLNGLVATEVSVSLYSEPGPVQAFACIVINDLIKIGSIRVVRLQSGRIVVAMPNRRRRNGDMSDTVHPIHRGARDWLEALVLDAYATACETLQTARMQEAV